MGGAVVHFEVMGTDGPKLWSFYSEMFGWEINSDSDPEGHAIRVIKGGS